MIKQFKQLTKMAVLTAGILAAVPQPARADFQPWVTGAKAMEYIDPRASIATQLAIAFGLAMYGSHKLGIIKKNKDHMIVHVLRYAGYSAMLLAALGAVHLTFKTTSKVGDMIVNGVNNATSAFATGTNMVGNWANSASTNMTNMLNSTSVSTIPGGPSITA